MPFPVPHGSRRRLLALIVGVALVATACGDAVESNNAAENTAATESGGSGEAPTVDRELHPDGWAGVLEQPDRSLYDPVEAGEDLPDGFRQLLNRDDIFPVYVPTFRRANQIDWPDEELVIGVELEGEARAYPVGFLNRREIVVDMHRGIPTFVTW